MSIPESRGLSYRLSFFPPTPTCAVFFHISVKNYWQFPSSPAPQGETGTYWNAPGKAETEKKKINLFSA